MKKLLCVLMLGLMFGQALIETREYELIIPGDELYWAELYFEDYDDFFDALNLTAGNYTIELIGVKGGWDILHFDVWCEDDDQEVFIPPHLGAEYFILSSDSLNYGQLHGCGSGYCDDPYSRDFSISKGCDIDRLSFTFDYFSGDAIANSVIKLWISGQFDDTDVGLQGDMNDDNDLDVLDVVLLVQEILNGGMGDVGDLINIVRG